MNLRKKYLFPLVIGFGLSNSGFSQIQPVLKSNIFFLAIGSGHYVSPYFSTINEANQSAKVFAQTLKAYGGFGYIIQSTQNVPLTKDTVEHTYSKLLAELDRSPKQNKILIIYFCGHGIADRQTNLLYAVPGVFRGNYRDPEVARTLESSLITFKDFNQSNWNNKNISQSIIFFDCCYEQNVPNYFLYRHDSIAYNDSLVKFSFKFRDEPDRYLYNEKNMNMTTIIYSCQPGQTVTFVPHPQKPKSRNVGPLCRRTLLALQHAAADSISLRNLIHRLFDDSLDTITNKPSIERVADIHAGYYLFRKATNRRQKK